MKRLYGKTRSRAVALRGERHRFLDVLALFAGASIAKAVKQATPLAITARELQNMLDAIEEKDKDYAMDSAKPIVIKGLIGITLGWIVLLNAPKWDKDKAWRRMGLYGVGLGIMG